MILIKPTGQNYRHRKGLAIERMLYPSANRRHYVPGRNDPPRKHGGPIHYYKPCMANSKGRIEYRTNYDPIHSTPGADTVHSTKNTRFFDLTVANHDQDNANTAYQDEKRGKPTVLLYERPHGGSQHSHEHAADTCNHRSL
jgi:hypothetical protein